MTDTRAELLQRAYYASTAVTYDDAHIEAAEHRLGLQLMLAAIRHYGSARPRRRLRHRPRADLHQARAADSQVVGIEPSAELRAVGHQKGLTADELREGDALRLPFDDQSFDLVCEFSASASHRPTRASHIRNAARCQTRHLHLGHEQLRAGRTRRAVDQAGHQRSRAVVESPTGLKPEVAAIPCRKATVWHIHTPCSTTGRRSGSIVESFMW